MEHTPAQVTRPIERVRVDYDARCFIDLDTGRQYPFSDPGPLAVFRYWHSRDGQQGVVPESIHYVELQSHGKMVAYMSAIIRRQEPVAQVVGDEQEVPDSPLVESKQVRRKHWAAAGLAASLEVLSLIMYATNNTTLGLIFLLAAFAVLVYIVRSTNLFLPR